MMCILQLALFVYGVMALCTGKLKVWKNRVVLGPAARMLGLLAMMPFPVAFGIGFYLGATRQVQAADDKRVILLDVGLALGTLFLVVAIGAAIGQPEPKKRRKRYDDEDDYDDEYDEDRPRRRRRRDEYDDDFEDEDDRDPPPRRTPRRDDDDEYDR